MKKYGLFILMFVCLMVSVPLQASATDGGSVQTEKVQLKFTYADVAITENQYLVRTETDESAKIEVFDIETGELVDTYAEDIEKIGGFAKGASARAAGDNYIVTTYKERTDGPNGNKVKTRLTVKMNVYSSGSFKQINSILSKTMAIVSSNDATLESIDTVAISTSGSFPTTEISANGTGVVTTKNTFSTSVEMNVGASAYRIAEFSVTISGGTGFEFYARKMVELSLNYSLY